MPAARRQCVGRKKRRASAEGFEAHPVRFGPFREGGQRRWVLVHGRGEAAGDTAFHASSRLASGFSSSLAASAIGC